MDTTNETTSDTPELSALPRMSATYSPEDNKLRLYTVSRLDAETYERVKAHGFRWAPKQELWVAPMWTPERAALLLELCGEIGDEDRSLVERAEERAERFEEYSDKREADAHSAHANVQNISKRFEFSQPILVGHHSERKARKDAEKIEAGMKRAVSMWETAQYWVRRAAGAIRHAKYKELPAVRHRRIKGLEADKRKQETQIAQSGIYVTLWSNPALTLEKATKIANYDRVSLPREPGKNYGESLWSALDKGSITPADAASHALKMHAAHTERAQEWLRHIENRIAYERAMLGETGGLPADRFPIVIGGRVTVSGWRARQGWLVVTRVNRVDDRISSVRTTEGVIGVEEISDYREPEPGDTAKVKEATKLPPIVNYPGEGFRHMTSAEYKSRAKHSDFYSTARIKATDTHGAHRRREAPKEGGPYYDRVGVYLTDAKTVERPAPNTVEVPKLEHVDAPLPEPRALGRAPKERTVFDDMKQSLKTGVQVVSAPQLFPTPAPLADRMVRAAGVMPHHDVLEPSAGTGAILNEIRKVGANVTAIEINEKLARMVGAVCDDFLTCKPGKFDRIVMNPPFADGADVEHVSHAIKMLKPGGRLVAVMSAGVEWKQDKRTVSFRELLGLYKTTIEKLPEDSFKESGTNVRTVLVTVDMNS